MKQAYCLVGQHLGSTAKCMKHRYDLWVHPQRFHRGQWVLYFNPRTHQGRQQKWERKYTPHLIKQELPAVNYLIQRTKQAKPFVAHVEKLRHWNTGNPPVIAD